MTTESKLYVIDGMALLFRSYYAMGQANLTSPDGTPVGAVYGFLRVLTKILKEQRPTHFAVVWDCKEKNFRHEMFPDYKANRSEPPEDIIPQIRLIQEVLPQLDVPSFRLPGFEADDLAGTLAKAARSWAEVFIVSADKDFMQLVDEQVRMFSLKKGDEYVVIDKAYVEDYFGVPPEKVIDVLAIMGDSSDNVPGVKGIGQKGAARLVQEFGSLDGVYSHIGQITAKRQKTLLEEARDAAYLSRKLVTIDCAVPFHFSQNDLRFTFEQFCLHPKLKTQLNALGMHSLLRTLLGDAAALERIHVSASVSEPPGGADPDGFSDRLFSDSDLFESQSPRDGSQLGQPLASSTEVADGHLASWGARHYRLACTEIELCSLFDRIASPKTQVFAFDTETTGLDIIADRPIGFSVSFSESEAWYVPAIPEHLPGGENGVAERAAGLGSDAIWARLQTALLARRAILVAHNAKFDLHMLENAGVKVGDAPVACTMVAAWLVDAQSGGYGLDAQTLKHTGLLKIPTSDLIGKKAGRQTMRDVPVDVLVEYACEDVDAALRLWKVHEAHLREKALFALFWELEMPVLRVLLQMERVGVHVDSAYLADLTVEIQDRLTNLEAEIFEQAGDHFKISSPKQLGAVLFEKLKVHEQLGYKGKLARTSLGFKTDSEVLEKFSAHPIVKCVQDYRELAKLLSTYVMVLPQLVKEKTGRIHTSYHQIGTATGRLSSSDPNLQNIPVRSEWGKKVRRAFSAPSSDRVILAVDYSQIELRVLAHLAEDPTMIAAFRAGADIHRETAAKIHGLQPAEVTQEMRSAAKAINFGIIYGMGPQRLAREQGVPLVEARAFIEKYFLNFSRIRSFLDTCRSTAHRDGYVKTAFGRIRPLPQLQSKNPGEARQAENMAINSPIQGTAADIMKLGMLKVYTLLQREFPTCLLIMQVHDELVLECPRDHVADIARRVRATLESVVSYSVPLIVDVGVGENWLEAK
jgi:DNA polymerase-1